MTADNEPLGRLLAEHAAARECGLLTEGPTAAERFRLIQELAKIEERSETQPSILTPQSSFLNRRSWIIAGAVAAGLVIGVGLWALLGGFRNPPPPEDQNIVKDDLPPKEERRDQFLNGRGLLVPVGDDTRYTLLDPARGRVRLDRGELFVGLPAGEDLQADIETPAGTATALGTSFYAHYEEAPEKSRFPFMTVAVVVGFVEVRNPHGRAMAGAGEVVLADGGSAPKRHSGSNTVGPPPAPEQWLWRLGSVPGMLQRSEVQVELKLTDDQKARLLKPSGDDWRHMGMFFRDLYSVPAEDRARKAADFRGVQEKKIAEVLDAVQQQRLGQLLLQQQGLSSLAQKDVADQLKLSDDQRRQVDAVIKQLGQARWSAFPRGPGNMQDIAKRMDELREKETKMLEALLTDAQKQQWQALTGDPFKLERRAGDWRDWWDYGNWGWDSGNWIDWRDHWRGPENWRGPWGPGGWSERWGPPQKQGPQK